MLDAHTNLSSLLKDPSLLVTQAYLAGDWVEGDKGARFDVVNPARGDVIARVADISRAQTAKAIAAADKAQKLWAARTAKESCGRGLQKQGRNAALATACRGV